MNQLDMFAAPVPQIRAENRNRTPEAPVAGVHRPERWWPAVNAPGREVAVCLGCSIPLYRTPGEEGLDTLDSWKDGFRPAGACEPRSRSRFASFLVEK